jgi:D-alanyl-D-alanine carboxypeptidase (penicillin-binding protein 5/6)
MKVSIDIRLSSIFGLSRMKELGRGFGVALVLILQIVLSASPARGQEYSLRIDAKSAFLLDGLSNQVVFEQNSQERVGPASLSKIMTLHLAYDALKNGKVHLHDEVIVSKKAWSTGGSKMFVKVGKRVKWIDLLKGIVVSSGNDACVALAEHLAGEEEVFVARMNEKARELGMKDTRFLNSHGLPAPGQYTTARDMALLASYHVETFPELLEIYSLKEFEFAGIKQFNRNDLLWRDEDVDGLKTGHTKESGFHIVATAKKVNQRFIAVVMGAGSEASREKEASRLLEYGFRNFSTVIVFEKGEILKEVRVWKGKGGRLNLVASTSGIVTVPRKEKESISSSLQIQRKILAPVLEGDKLGKAIIEGEGTILKEVDLLAESEVPKAGFLIRIWHSFLLFLVRLFSW